MDTTQLVNVKQIKINIIMTYKELMNKCAEIYKRYAAQGNPLLGMSTAREYCAENIDQCTEVTEDQIETVHSMDEYKCYKKRIKNEEREKQIKENRKNNPEEYKLFEALKKKYEL